MLITRSFKKQAVRIAASAALTGVIDVRAYAGGTVIGSAAWTAANIGFQVSSDGASWYILRDKSGAPVQIAAIETGTACAYDIPAEVFGAGYVKLWSKSATAATVTDANQAAARDLIVMLKG